jgi:hypothetical protein
MLDFRLSLNLTENRIASTTIFEARFIIGARAGDKVSHFPRPGLFGVNLDMAIPAHGDHVVIRCQKLFLAPVKVVPFLSWYP